MICRSDDYEVRFGGECEKKNKTEALSNNMGIDKVQLLEVVPTAWLWLALRGGHRGVRGK